MLASVLTAHQLTRKLKKMLKTKVCRSPPPPEVWFRLAVMVAIFRPFRWFSHADRFEYHWAKL